MGVDKSAATAAGVACSLCSNFGASVYCKVSGCDNVYHLPCGSSSGAIMDQHSTTLLCPNHVQKTPAMLPGVVCSVCGMFAPGHQFVWCVSCNAHYHASCLKPPISPTPVVRAGYQCNDCKTCQICNHPAEDLTCNVCNKAFHSSCAKPFGLNASKADWKCKTCRVCGDCGARTPGNGNFSRWHANFTVCDSCYQLRNKGLACPICMKAYRAVMQKEMAQCTLCRKHVHKGCDADADVIAIATRHKADPTYEYHCTACRTSPRTAGVPFIRASEDSSEGGTQDSCALSDQDSMDTSEDSTTPSSGVSSRRTTFSGLAHNALSSLLQHQTSSNGGSSSPVACGTAATATLASAFWGGGGGGGAPTPATAAGTGNGGTGNLSTSLYLNRGKPLPLNKRGNPFLPRMRGGVGAAPGKGGKGNSVARKQLGVGGGMRGSKRGKMVGGGVGVNSRGPRGRGGMGMRGGTGAGYRGYFNYQQQAVMVSVCNLLPCLHNLYSCYSS